MRTCIVIALFVVCAVTALSQQLSSQTRAQAIAEAFTKHKNVTKEKHGARMEKYKDVRSEPLVKQNIADYSGVYEVADVGYRIDIRVGADGTVQADGQENRPQARTFRLENAKIDGALLTAAKIYQDGATEAFEGVFLKRTSRNSPTDPGATIVGLGVVLSAPFELNGLTYDKLFYQLK